MDFESQWSGFSSLCSRKRCQAVARRYLLLVGPAIRFCEMLNRARRHCHPFGRVRTVFGSLSSGTWRAGQAAANKRSPWTLEARQCFDLRMGVSIALCCGAAQGMQRKPGRPENADPITLGVAGIFTAAFLSSPICASC